MGRTPWAQRSPCQSPTAPSCAARSSRLPHWESPESTPEQPPRSTGPTIPEGEAVAARLVQTLEGQRAAAEG
eukprot:14433265-Alexandrium_andersonii.AAC.1